MVLLALVLFSFLCGRYDASVSEVIQALMFQGDAIIQSLVWNIRIPRILLVMIAGAALSLSGMIYQTIFHNPLASGDVIGVSSGCSLGAMIAILYVPSVLMIQTFSFIGGIVAVGCSIALARKGKGNRVLQLVIAGIIMQALITSVMMMLKLQADPFHELASIEYWLMGGFSEAGWMEVCLCFGIVLICSGILYVLRWQIQMLAFKEEAETMGVAVKKIRFVAILCATLLISSVISVAGIVSWVGLLVPHMIRLWVKEPLSKSFGVTMLCGAGFLLLCDTLARSLFVIELPISILTSLFGAICLIILFLKGRLSL